MDTSPGQIDRGGTNSELIGLSVASSRAIMGRNEALWSNPTLVARLACPSCKNPINWRGSSGECLMCGLVYPVEDGIPILLKDKSGARHDEIGHDHAKHKQAQATYFDRQHEENFEITRPRGTPKLYDWLLRKKFYLGTAGIRSILPGATVLVLCGGSGMDGEFLAEAGANVITSDISLGAARRAAERARRFSLSVGSIVADVEALPAHDRGVDMTYVHDGLHHLAKPRLGVSEMIRVAAKAVSINEPAEALATKFAVRFNLATDVEDAGNRVERLRPEEVRVWLQTGGLIITKGERYAMFYRHYPGWAMRVFSAPGLAIVSTTAYQAVIAISGRFGNKLTVQATRARS